MKLSNFFPLFGKKPSKLEDSIAIKNIAYHTEQVRTGSCFVAIRGYQTDGHRYIPQAIAKGATVILTEEDIFVPKGVTKILVSDTRDGLGRLSALFYGAPTKELKLVGITGTNGKTTTAFLLDAIWRAGGARTGLISTLRYRWPGHDETAVRTTPESSDLQKMFREMVRQRVSHAVMEVTSHALDLKRVIGCHFDGAIFTNISPDHLDHHQNMEHYFATKALLFRERLVVSDKRHLWAAINWDDPYGRTLIGGLPAKVWRFSRQEKTDVFVRKSKIAWTGTELELESPSGVVEFHSCMVGNFNVMNLLAAVSAALAMEISRDQIVIGLTGFSGVPGRFEKVTGHQEPFQVFVDYAHTPDALENVLSTLRALQPKRILTLFGCGGNRDKRKRPLMAKAVAKNSDVVIVTTDNPRFENPETIMEETVLGFPVGQEFHRILDRKQAITQLLNMAQPGDCLLIAGKGAEDYQEIEGVKHPFDDRQIVREFLGASPQKC